MSRRTWRSRSTRRNRAVGRSPAAPPFGSALRTSHTSEIHKGPLPRPFVGLVCPFGLRRAPGAAFHLCFPSYPPAAAGSFPPEEKHPLRGTRVLKGKAPPRVGGPLA